MRKVGSRNFEWLINKIVMEYYSDELFNREPKTDVFLIKAPLNGRLAPTGWHKWTPKYNKAIKRRHLKEIERRLLNTQFPLSVTFERLPISPGIVKRANRIQRFLRIQSLIMVVLMIFSVCLLLGAHIHDFNAEEIADFYLAFHYTSAAFFVGLVIILFLWWRQYILKEQSKILYADIFEKRQEQMGEVLNDYNDKYLYDEGFECQIGPNGACFYLRRYEGGHYPSEIMELPLPPHKPESVAAEGDNQSEKTQSLDMENMPSFNSTFMDDIDLDDYAAIGDGGGSDGDVTL